MVSEARKQSTAWMETDLMEEHLGALGPMGEMAPLILIFDLESMAAACALPVKTH